MPLSRLSRTLSLLVLGLGVWMVATSIAQASPTQQAALADRDLLLNPARVIGTLHILKVLGIDRIRIGINWNSVAPSPDSRVPPASFDGADPAAYPAANWGPYDELVTAAARDGISVNFDLGGPAPLWAVGRAPSANMAHVWYPSAPEFAGFVKAVGTRYSGTYVPPAAASPLPRVSSWSIWNEPNVGSSSLSPQTVNGIEVAPRLYRALADAAFASLAETGHSPGRDTVLMGELASTGHLDPGATLGMQPLRFLRAMFCVDAHYQPLLGGAAAARGCPATAAAASRFRAENPALFQASGWSHHPYHLTAAPNVQSPAIDADWVTLAELPKLENALDRVQHAYGSSRRYPIYITEYGVETNPPRPDFATTPALQALYLNQAEYLTWRDPRVKMFTQFLLQDAPPGGGSSVSSFASGLVFADGRPKPALAAYRLPIWLPVQSVSHGKSVEVWGCIRPAKNYPAVRRQVEIQLDGRTIRTLTVANPEGYFDAHVVFPRSGAVRLAWRYPGGPTAYSRTVTVTEVGAGGLSPAIFIALGAGVLVGIGVVFLRRRERMTTSGR